MRREKVDIREENIFCLDSVHGEVSEEVDRIVETFFVDHMITYIAS